jgi:sulfur carrier protein
VRVIVNGHSTEVDESATVADLVTAVRGHDDRKGVAVAINGEVVARSEWDSRQLDSSDQVEVLRAVGGG